MKRKSKKQEGKMLQQESKGGRGRVCRGETKGKNQRDSQRDSQRESQREMPERDAEPEPKNEGEGEGGAQCQQHYQKTNETTISVKLVLKGRERHSD